jgi:hypothetical protein
MEQKERSKRLITIDEAVKLAAEAGFAKCDRRWWRAMMDKAVFETVNSAYEMVYLREWEVTEFISEMKAGATSDQ